MRNNHHSMVPAAGHRTGAPVKRDASAGLTILETLIVLSIAGVILLVIFEAIPAVIRSGHNNQRRQDVQTILSAVSRYELNDSGNFPADCDGAPHACTDPGGPTPNDYFLQFEKNKLTYYSDKTQVVLANQPDNGSTTHSGVTNLDTVYVYNYQKCDSSGGGSTWIGAGYTDVVALFAIESGNNARPLPQCQQL